MIELRHLSKVYGKGKAAVVALNDIDLVVERGEISAIVGPSGAGKSTLSRCINMLERPTSGAVVVNGVELTGRRQSQLPAARREIGTVFQSSSLLSRRTAAENVSLPLEYMGVVPHQRKARVRELLGQVGLTDRVDHFPHQLSGGERQRVGIARALALRPSVLLADEATSGLDPDSTSSVLNLLHTLRDELDLTILMITHEMEVVRGFADRVSRLHAGKIIQSGLVVDLVTDPTSPLGSLLLPERKARLAPAGQETWKVTYGPETSPDWIGRLSQSLESPISLLGATVEEINGVSVGHVIIGMSPEPPQRILGLLRKYGLHGEQIDSARRLVSLTPTRNDEVG